MSTNTMKAIRQHEFGGPEVLRYEEAPLPELKPGEVLVRVHAVGINPPDWYLREGYKDLPPEWQPAVSFPLILGSDMSGVVEAVATDVQGFSIGDEVFGMVRFPSMGESASLCRVRYRTSVGSCTQTCWHRSCARCRGADGRSHRLAVPDRVGAQ